MKQRRGMGLGTGLKGYYNMLPNDALIHGLSAKGVSQNLYAKSSTSPLELIRVPYGKASTKRKNREYVMRGGSPVGTLTEWEDFANVKNIDKIIVNDIEDVFMLNTSKKKMKTLKAESISSGFTIDVPQPDFSITTDSGGFGGDVDLGGGLDVSSADVTYETPTFEGATESFGDFGDIKEVSGTPVETQEKPKHSKLYTSINKKIDEAKEWVKQKQEEGKQRRAEEKAIRDEKRKKQRMLESEYGDAETQYEEDIEREPTIEELSDVELEDKAIKNRPSFIGALTGMSNQYEKELVRRTETREKLHRKLAMAKSGASESTVSNIGKGVWGFITNPSGETTQRPKLVQRKQRKNKGGNGGFNFKEFIPIP